MDSGLYEHLAAAYVRGLQPDSTGLDDAACIQLGRDRGVRLHRFKRTSELPRVRRVLGTLAGLSPTSLLDVGSGRGVFLWPLLDGFKQTTVYSVDVLRHRVAAIHAVRRGGIHNLSVCQASGAALPFADGAFDVVTLLEVLEHQDEPALMVAESLRCSARAVVVSVPSKEDDNPEHVQLFTGDSLTELFLSCSAKRVNVEFVPNHIVAVVLK